MLPSPIRLAVVEREPSNRYGIQCVQAEGKDRMDFYDGSAALNEYATGDLGLPADRSPRPTIEQAVRAMIAATGDDPDREGLLETPARVRSEEHTSELQSLMRNSYAVFCLKKNNKKHRQ